LTEKEYYDIVREWLEDQGYYCGGNIEVGGKPNFYQNMGTKHRRADVVGVKNVGNRFEDDVEVVAIEVKDKRVVSVQDFDDAAKYQQCAHKCYLATTAEITDECIRWAERKNLGLLQLQKGKKPKVLRHPIPKQPDYKEMLAFLESFEIVRCSICGCFFERFVRSEEKYQSFFEMKRAAYFNAMKNTSYDPLNFKEIPHLSPEYKIYRYICYPCLEELFPNSKVVKRVQEAREEMKESHAYWSNSEKGFLCLVGKEKECTEYVYDPIEIVEHLRNKHNIDPDDQIIKGWTKKYQEMWEKHAAKK
jgi:predicted nuclease of predicted toxin-antitoxin system